MVTADYLFDKKIIWLGDDLICSNNFPYFKEKLIAVLEALIPEFFYGIKSLTIDEIETELNQGQCLWYIRLFRKGVSYNISYYVGDEFDLEDAMLAHREWVDEGFKPLKWSDVVGDTDINSYDVFDKLNESEEDELEWAKDIVSQKPIPKRVLINNKRYGIPDKVGYNESWRKINKWTDWYKVIDIGEHLGELCFIVRLSPDYPKVFIPISDFTEKELEVAHKKFMSESKEYSNVSHLINKKIWFDYPTEREDIEKVNQFFIDNGFRGLESDNIDEFEDFIYDSDVAYFKLKQHISPLFTDEERRPYVDYYALDWPNPERLKNDPSFIHYQDILSMTDTTLDILSNLNESVEEPQPKVGDFLYCHKDVIMEDDYDDPSTREATVGKLYPIVKVLKNKDRLEIINNSRTEHQFSLDPKTDWYYGVWFHLVPKEHKQEFDSFNSEDIFNQLD